VTHVKYNYGSKCDLIKDKRSYW